jgi:hypothetical protein
MIVIRILVQVHTTILKYRPVLKYNQNQRDFNFLDQLLNVLQITKIQSKNYKMLGQELMKLQMVLL